MVKETTSKMIYKRSIQESQKGLLIIVKLNIVGSNLITIEVVISF